MQKRRDRMERATGIEPAYTAWKAVVLPLNYARFLMRLQRDTTL